MSTLDSILSGEGAPASEPQAAAPATPETTQEQPQGQPEPASNDEPQTDERGMVPVAALQAERQKAKRYTEQVAEFQQHRRHRDQTLAVFSETILVVV